MGTDRKIEERTTADSERERHNCGQDDAEPADLWLIFRELVSWDMRGITLFASLRGVEHAVST
jgi:hypothetical protein